MVPKPISITHITARLHPNLNHSPATQTSKIVQDADQRIPQGVEKKSITIQNSTETGLDSKLTVLFEFKHKGVIYVQFSFDFGDDPKIFTNVQVARVHVFYKLYSIIAICKSGFVVVRIIL